MGKEITRSLTIKINGKDVQDSLKGIGGEIRTLKRELRNAATEEERALANEKLKEAKKRYAEINDELRDTKVTLSDMKGSFENVFNSFLSGDIDGVKNGLSEISGGIRGATKSALAFIATPVGAALAVLAAGFAAGKAVFDYNQGLREMNEELRALGVSAESMSGVRSEIKATADTFDKDFKEIAQKAKSLSESYGISMSEANRVITEGLANGGAKNTEFLDSLGEYDQFFSSMGFSAQQTADIINKGYELGIYTDKLPDALKEADLALKEQTKSSRDALVNAFGASFSDDLLKRVSSGQTTTKKALEEIAKKAETANLSQQQQAQLTADIFKGAGEDAGGALKILQAVGQTAERELSKTAKAQIKLADANTRLNKAQASLFEIKGFGDMWSSIKSVSIDALAAMLEYVADVKKDIQPLIDFVAVIFVNAWNQLKFVVTSAFDIISGLVKASIAPWKGFANAFKKLLKGDVVGAWNAVITGFKNGYKLIGNIFVDLYNNAVDFVKNLLDVASPLLEKLGFNVDDIKSKLEGLKSKKFKIEGEVSVTNETTNTETNKQNNAVSNNKSQEVKDREAKEAEERKKKREKELADAKAAALSLAKAKSELAAIQLQEYIANHQSQLDEDKKLSAENLKQEDARLKGIQQKRIAFLEQEKQQKLADLDASNIAEEEKNTRELAITKQFELDKQAVELEAKKEGDALKKEYDAEQKERQAEEDALNEEKKALAEELALAEADGKFEAEKIKNQQAYDNELLGYKELLDKKKITEGQYDRFKEVADKKRDALENARQLNQLQGTLGGMNQLAGALGEMFGQSKSLAVVQAGINGAMAVTSILAQYPKFDGGFAMTAAIASAGISTVAQIAKITSSKAPKKPKFFYGGHTGSNAALGHDEYGPITGYVHKKEWVAPEWQTQDPATANVIGWLENRRQNKITGFVDGGGTSPGAITAPADASEESAQKGGEATVMLMGAINTLSGLLAQGINAKVVIGYEEAQSIDNLNTESNESENNGILAE